MTSTLPPFPIATGLKSSFAMAPANVPDLPSGEVQSPSPRRKTPITPFGELRQPPVVKTPEPIPPLKQAPESKHPEEEAPDYTDADLAAAISPLVVKTFPTSLAGPDPTEFEPILRTALRRALSEHTRGAFNQPDFTQRCLWRFDALLSSRSYEEIVQQKIRRFRIEEVYLFDNKTLSLISFASVDPTRHCSARKIHTLADRVALRLRADSGTEPLEFSVEGTKRALVTKGKLSQLVVLVRGEADSLARRDLSYAVKRIEDNFHKELEDGTPILQELQPYLEECLLIHSPMAPSDV